MTVHPVTATRRASTRRLTAPTSAEEPKQRASHEADEQRQDKLGRLAEEGTALDRAASKPKTRVQRFLGLDLAMRRHRALPLQLPYQLLYRPGDAHLAA